MGLSHFSDSPGGSGGRRIEMACRVSLFWCVVDCPAGGGVAQRVCVTTPPAPAMYIPTPPRGRAKRARGRAEGSTEESLELWQQREVTTRACHAPTGDVTPDVIPEPCTRGDGEWQTSGQCRRTDEQNDWNNAEEIEHSEKER